MYLSRTTLRATIVIAAGLVYSGGALADGPGPVRYYAQPYNWSGAYIGINAGAVWGDIDGKLTAFGNAPFNVNLDTQFVLGGHVGYQKQMGNWVLGVEGGYSAMERGGEWGHTDAGPDCGNVAPCEARIRSIWQVGGRLGYAQNNWMVYGTGGWAQADVGTRTTPTFEVASATHNGLCIGTGLEFLLTKNVILGAEYLHYDFSRETQTSATGVCPQFCVRSVDPEADIVRARLSFKFGDEERRPLK